MRLIASIKSFSHFKDIYNVVDGIVIRNDKFSTSYNTSFEIEEMKEIIEYSKDKQVIIDITTMYTNDLMNELEEFIKFFLEYDVYYLYSDIGCHTLLKKYNIQNKGIYDPKTLITNSYDLNHYLSTGMNALSLSLEIPTSDIDQIISKKKGNVWYKCFGYHQMFHSKRHLISVYEKHLGHKIEMNNDSSYLKEQTRNELYHIVETQHGTLLYRPYVVSMLEKLSTLKSCDYLFMDSMFMNEELFNNALHIYRDTLSNNKNLNESLNELSEMFHIEAGFMNEDSVYIKPEVTR